MLLLLRYHVCALLVLSQIHFDFHLCYLQLAREVLDIAALMVKPGVTTEEIDHAVHLVYSCKHTSSRGWDVVMGCPVLCRCTSPRCFPSSLNIWPNPVIPSGQTECNKIMF